MEQVKVKMSENCERMYDTLLKGCGITRKDINKIVHGSGIQLMYESADGLDDYFSIEFYITSLIDLMSSINYKFIHCSTNVLAQLNVYWGLPNEECKELIPECDIDGTLQMVFGEEFDCDDTGNLVVFEVSEHECPSYYIDRITFIEKSGNTVLFDEDNGFNMQVRTALTEEQEDKLKPYRFTYNGVHGYKLHDGEKFVLSNGDTYMRLGNTIVNTKTLEYEYLGNIIGLIDSSKYDVVEIIEN